VPLTWKDASHHKQVASALVVDDFGARCTNRSNVGCLISTLNKGHKTHVGWKGERHAGLVLKRDCKNRTCGISVPGCVERALERLKHRHQNDLSALRTAGPNRNAALKSKWPKHRTPTASADMQGAQEVLGCCLHHARAVDCAVPPAIGTLATQQAKPAIATLKGPAQLLNCAATHPGAEVRFRGAISHQRCGAAHRQ
jgi:hypothetical protein